MGTMQRRGLWHPGRRFPQLGRVAIIAMIFLIALAPAVRAEELTVAAAADLTFALKDVAASFERQSGNRVRISYGSSGNFFSQISNGAPFDVFFSADVKYPDKLAGAGLVEPGTLYEYASGRIVIWVPARSPIELGRGLDALLAPEVHKIAIANPEHAPYGRAAVAALRHQGIYDRVAGKLVMGEDISQTAQFVQSGNADAGIIALSLALAPAMKERGRYAMIPPDDYPPIVQAAVVIRSSKHKRLARSFIEFMKEPETVTMMRQYGFIQPSAAQSAAASAK